LPIIHYRRLSRQTPTITAASLREAMGAALDSPTGDEDALLRTSFRFRTQLCSDAHNVILNAYSRQPQWIFAEFLRAEPNATLTTVKSTGGQEVAEISQYASPEGTAPHRGSLYALIHGDHVLFVTKGHFTLKCFEDFITWFLRKGTALSNDRRAVLETRTPSADQMRVNKVRVSLDGLGSDNVSQPEETDEPVPERRPVPESVLKALLVADADIRRMVEGGEVDVDVLLTFKHGHSRRNFTVGALNTVFRNVEDAEFITFDGPSGPVDALGARLRGTKKITMNGSLFDADDARRKLLDQLEEWRVEGHIQLN
jgi:hypothetical protein